MARGRAGDVPRGAAAWSGRGVAKAREFMAATTKWPTVCGQCKKRVDKSSNWVVGHIKSRATHPELTWDRTNWRIEHRKCSDKSGQRTVIEKARAEGARSVARATPPLPLHTSEADETRVTRARSADSLESSESSGFSRSDGHVEAPPLSTYESAGQTPISANDALLWSSHDLSLYPWLHEFQTIPADASAPLYMTPVPADAVGSYGPEACDWIDAELGITLRWWQRLSIIRQLEHRADGSLCFNKKLESAPRRAGKSVGLRGGALWRMEHGLSLFGEDPIVMHTGSDIPICREIQRHAWAWAERRGWNVSRGAGQETIETQKNGGARWMVRSQDGVYGYDVMLGHVDEGWNVKPDTVGEGLEPAMLERSSPQLVLTSTAHRRATSLMRTELANALTMLEPETLLLLWGADADCDPGDPAVWKAASPHWSEARHKMIAAKYAKALAGEDDPEFDDPDPMRGFMAQYLNVWTIAEKRLIGKPVIEADGWAALAGSPSGASLDAVAVESWFDQGISVARARKLDDGHVLVSVEDFETMEAAAARVATYGLKRPVQVGTSLASHPAWRRHGVRVESVGSATRTQVAALMRMLRDDVLRHHDADALSEQVLALRVSPGVDGPRIRSTERADAIKAATWAAQAAASRASSHAPRRLVTV